MTEQITNIFTLEELLSIPLHAVIDANAHAAETALDFIIRYGFNPGVPELPNRNRFLGSLRMAQFTYNYVNDQGMQSTMEVSIPFLSLIPIPMLEVKKATFDYAIQILSQDYIEDRRSILAIMSPIDTSLREQPQPYIGTSLRANMAIRVEVEKADLPAGILQLLNLGQEATRGRPERQRSITAKPDRLEFRPGESKTISILVEQPGDDGSIELIGGAEVAIEVTNDFKRPAKLFAGPIEVLQGSPIGRPTPKIAIARTLLSAPDKGLVKFQLTRRDVDADAADAAGVNGFITVRVKRATDLLIYFTFLNA
jgi:hypothetical protein